MPYPRISLRAFQVAGRRPDSRWKVFALALLASLVLSGCVTRIAYDRLDWLTRWYIDSYLDLTESQDRLAREITRRNLAWHRATQLPLYADHIRELRAGLSGPVTAGFIEQQYAITLVIWDQSMRHMAPDISRLLLTLDDAQLIGFFAEIEEQNVELAEEYSGLAADARRKKQDRSIIRAFAWFTGSLSPEQEAVVRSHTAGMHDLTEQWLSRRAAWQSALRELLDRRSGNADFEAQIADLLLNPDQFDSPEYRQSVAANRATVFAMVAEVLSSMSPKQRRHLDDRLSGLITDFDELARIPAS
jgi:hypothetical protein